MDMKSFAEGMGIGAVIGGAVGFATAWIWDRYFKKDAEEPADDGESAEEGEEETMETGTATASGATVHIPEELPSSESGIMRLSTMPQTVDVRLTYFAADEALCFSDSPVQVDDEPLFDEVFSACQEEGLSDQLYFRNADTGETYVVAVTHQPYLEVWTAFAYDDETYFEGA